MTGDGALEALLQAVNDGDTDARDRLVERFQHELRAIARSQLKGEPGDVLMQTTLLVNEAYLKLFGGKPTRWKNRAHFFGAARRAMRQFLVDEARRRKGAKRNDGRVRVTLGEWIPQAGGNTVDAIAFVEALDRLERLDPRQAAVVGYKCLLGLTDRETAELLGVSRRTVVDDWTHAKAWLKVELG